MRKLRQNKQISLGHTASKLSKKHQHHLVWSKAYARDPAQGRVGHFKRLISWGIVYLSLEIEVHLELYRTFSLSQKAHLVLLRVASMSIVRYGSKGPNLNEKATEMSLLSGSTQWCARSMRHWSFTTSVLCKFPPPCQVVIFGVWKATVLQESHFGSRSWALCRIQACPGTWEGLWGRPAKGLWAWGTGSLLGKVSP